MSERVERYDEIGRTYTATRREDPRIAAQIVAAVGPGSVLNVGAGSGNYEPRGRRVVAVEPSPQMIEQRAVGAAPAVRGIAEALPFADDSFDVAMGVLTIHHWADPVAGLAELRRVARRQVLFYFEQQVSHSFWLLDYFPEARAVSTEIAPPGERLLREQLNVVDVQTVEVPRDCTDGFGVAYWARPEAYLDAGVQAGMSFLAMLDDAARQRGTDRLRRALESGDWQRQHGHLLDAETFDGGYRLAVAERR